MPTDSRSRANAVLATVVALSVLHCNGDTTQVLCLDDLGSSTAGQKLQTFIDTSDALIAAANEVDLDMRSACRSMAHDLGIPTAELAPPPANAAATGVATDVVCRRLNAEIDRIIHNNLTVNARLAVVHSPPLCAVDPDTQLRCNQECDPATTIQGSRLPCASGHAYGQCMTSCLGRCTGSCAGACAGTCVATCTGTCSGSCNGACGGTCGASNIDGTCFGTCAGVCTGVCDGTCMGSCTGTCAGACTSSCSGTCQGECSSWVEPPQCAQTQEITTAADCQTNCDARARFQATCTEPSLLVAYGRASTTPQKAALDRLVLALRNNFAKAVKIGYRATFLLQKSGNDYRAVLEEVSPTSRQIGLGAAACVADRITRVNDALAKIEIGVEINAALSDSVSASGGLPPP